MTTMNRLYASNSERQSVHLSKAEMGLCVVYSSKEKLKRRNCILNT